MYSTSNVITSDIKELQSDILAEKLSENPYLRYHTLLEKNKKLGTVSQTVIGAINETLAKVNSVDKANRAALAELYNVLGHIGMHPELITKVLSVSPSLIDLVVELKEKVNEVTTNTSVAKDIFVVGEEPQTVFDLSSTPKSDTVKMFVNGILYSGSDDIKAFSCDPSDKKVYWLFSKMNGGFNLANSEVIFEYEFE